jgi:hypothetical protein
LSPRQSSTPRPLLGAFCGLAAATSLWSCANLLDIPDRYYALDDGSVTGLADAGIPPDAVARTDATLSDAATRPDVEDGLDASMPLDGSTREDATPAMDATGGPDVVTDAGITDVGATPPEAASPCDNAPAGFICGCRSVLECLDSGSCCCLYPGTVTTCDLRHDCPINGGTCI